MRIELPPKATRDELDARALELVRALEADFGAARQSAVTETPKARGDRPTDAAFRAFTIAAKNWFREMMQIRAEFGANAGDEFAEYYEELVRFGYATLHPVKTFGRGGQIKFLLPTVLGQQKLREAHAPFMDVRGDAPHGRNGDGTHIYYQNRIAQTLTHTGWTVQIEQTLRNKRVDVGAIRNGVMHAYEVVNTDISKELRNLVQDLDDGWQRVVFCIGNERDKRTLKDLIVAELPLLVGHCDFALLSNYR